MIYVGFILTNLHMFSQVAQFVAKLMTPEERLDAFKFVCFRCPAGMSSHSKLRVHSESVGHARLQSKNVVSCEACKRYFENTFHLELHNLTLAHR